MADQETTGIGDNVEAEFGMTNTDLGDVELAGDAEFDTIDNTKAETATTAKAAKAAKAAKVPKVSKEAKAAASAKLRTKKGYTRIVLEESDEIPPSGLYVGVNDRSYLLKPGVEADVPQGVIDVLENAIMSAPRIDPQSRRVVGYKDRHRYPFRRM